MPVEVRVEHVTKVFGAITAVAGVTLEIQRGEFFTLLGPSGSGKTTLLRIIAGLEGPSSGRVFIGGIDATDLPPNRRPTSTVFQDLALFPHMSVGRNVEYGLRLRGVNHLPAHPARNHQRSVVRAPAVVQRIHPRLLPGWGAGHAADLHVRRDECGHLTHDLLPAGSTLLLSVLCFGLAFVGSTLLKTRRAWAHRAVRFS